ncbi:hypothetical protein CRG98_045649 [Punica granatum]|uniref:Uncharacterized protein n=1 Tax=Punica granatum TaxID=22663 RepID=A0A2I0HR78_PUNGR|nr:hypothetical protein CRG98_045649 [Punica granatum]
MNCSSKPGWRMAWRHNTMHGLVLQGPCYLGMGAPNQGVITSPKPSEDLWGPVWWYSRLDPFPHSEPLTNIASYFGARGISNVVTRNPLG